MAPKKKKNKKKKSKKKAFPVSPADEVCLEHVCTISIHSARNNLDAESRKRQDEWIERKRKAKKKENEKEIQKENFARAVRSAPKQGMFKTCLD